MILVTGAAGKTGQAVIAALVAALAHTEEPIRALVYRAEQRATALAIGAAQAHAGDMRLPETLIDAAAGARAIYHIAPNMSPHELEMGRHALRAATLARVDRFVYHSVLHPQVEEMPHHWYKMRVEEEILRSGLPFTILQPAAYMQNILAGWPTILDGAYRVPYPVTTRLSLVDLADVAQVAAEALVSDEHDGAIYELAGTLPLSQQEVAEALSRSLGRTVAAQRVPLIEWESGARAAGVPEHAVDNLLRMFRY